MTGKITLKDSSTKEGLIKWVPRQHEALWFRESQAADSKKYFPKELLGFTVDSLQFLSLFDLKVYAEIYGLLGKLSDIRYTFGQVVDTGKFDIYFVIYRGLDAATSQMQSYPNFYFRKQIENGYEEAAFPFYIRMTNRQFAKAKEKLYLFFDDYPEIVGRLKSSTQQDDLWNIIELMKNSN